MKISIVGHVCIDNNHSEKASYIAAGGPAVFMNKIYRFFEDVTMTVISPYGHDFQPYSADLVLLPDSPITDKTLSYENHLQDGVRSQKALNREQAFKLSFTQDIKDILKESEIVIIAPLLPTISAATIEKIKKASNKEALLVLLPQGFYRAFSAENEVIERQFEEWQSVLPYVDLVIVSQEDNKQIEQDISQWTAAYPDLIVAMTMAEKGVRLFYQQQVKDVSNTPVAKKEIVDSVGSGDIFAAAFSYQYRLTTDLVSAAKFANQVARQSLFFKADEIKIFF